MAIVDVQKSKYGDFVITSNGFDVVPRFKDTDRIIFKGYKSAPNRSVFLCNSETHGTLYATQPMHDIFPMVENDEICSAAVVILIDKRYTVLVKLHKRPDLFNPSGGRKSEEIYKECAVREAKEETGLDIFNLKKLAKWKRDTDFGGLQWKGCNVAFMAEARMPSHWQLNWQLGFTVILIDNPEVEKLYVLDLKKINYLEETLQVSPVHMRLVREAYSRTKKYCGHSFEFIY